MYYIHPQLENDTFDNGLLWVFLVWLACFQFLGLSNPNDKEAQKNAGTTAMRALENSSHMECPFSHFEDTRKASLLPASYRAFPSSPLRNLLPLHMVWGHWAAAPSSEPWCSQISFSPFDLAYLGLVLGLSYPTLNILVYSWLWEVSLSVPFWCKVFPTILP